MVLVQAILAAIVRSAGRASADDAPLRRPLEAATRTSPADLPAADAHSEAQLPKAA
jgi:hypothetical protein